MDALPPLVAEHLGEVRALCEKYHVRKLTIFGSAVKGTFDPAKSDLDFVVDLDEDPEKIHYPWGGRAMALQADLATLYDRNIDIVDRSAIENPYFIKVLALTEQPIYDRSRAA
jgi:predicted nucleotidyltransferase